MTECVHAFCVCIYRCNHFFLTVNASGHTSDEGFSSLAILYAYIPGEIYLLFAKIIGYPCYARNTKHIKSKHLLIDSYQTRDEELSSLRLLISSDLRTEPSEDRIITGNT